MRQFSPIPALLLLAAAASAYGRAPARSPGHATEEDGLREWEEQAPPKTKELIDDMDKKAREREAARKQRGLQPGQSPADEEQEQAPAGRPAPRDQAGPANLADLIQAAEEEKLRAPRDAVNSMAVVKAPGVLALTESYFYHVYCYGNGGDGDTSAMLAAIRRSLEKPRGWGNFPTIQIGLRPSDDHPDNQNVLGTWNAPGEIRLKAGKGETLKVVSHEVRHHNDGVWAGPLDGNGWPKGEKPPRDKPEENYAYGTMTKEMGGQQYVHCQPRPLISPLKS